MDIRERLEAFWRGERPDEIPYTVYYNEWRHVREDPAWATMFQAGLGVTCHVRPYTMQRSNFEEIEERTQQGGDEVYRETMRTPVGEITHSWRNGWREEFLLKTREDYAVMTYIAQHTTYQPNYEAFLAKERELAPYGVVLSLIGRTPLQTILVDLAGLEQLSYHLVDWADEVRQLYDALLANFRCVVALAARGPGRFISNLENFTAESLGPQRYKEFLLPVYEECFPALRLAGKVVGCHYDGRTASCRELIARAPFDLVESLTEPNEGDQTLAEARAAWPDKLFWCNIRVGDYQLPPAQLHAKVLDLVRQGAPDGRRLAFEVSEHLPVNWRESLPVVLAALKETRQKMPGR